MTRPWISSPAPSARTSPSLPAKKQIPGRKLPGIFYGSPSGDTSHREKETVLPVPAKDPAVCSTLHKHGIPPNPLQASNAVSFPQAAPAHIKRACPLQDRPSSGLGSVRCLGCVCKPSSRNRVTTGKCATMTSLKTSGSGLSPYCQQKVLLVEGDRLVTSETFSMLYIGCCEPDLHGELCQRNMVRGKPYIPDSGVGRKEDI